MSNVEMSNVARVQKYIEQNPDSRPVEIAVALGLPKASIGGTLSALNKKGVAASFNGTWRALVSSTVPASIPETQLPTQLPSRATTQSSNLSVPLDSTGAKTVAKEVETREAAIIKLADLIAKTEEELKVHRLILQAEEAALSILKG